MLTRRFLVVCCLQLSTLSWYFTFSLVSTNCSSTQMIKTQHKSVQMTEVMNLQSTTTRPICLTSSSFGSNYQVMVQFGLDQRWNHIFMSASDNRQSIGTKLEHQNIQLSKNILRGYVHKKILVITRKQNNITVLSKLGTLRCAQIFRKMMG